MRRWLVGLALVAGVVAWREFARPEDDELELGWPD